VIFDTYHSRVACNTYIVGNDNNEGFLVDPGINVNNALIEHIKKIGVTIKAILITHAHMDHISALEEVLKEVGDVKVYIFKDEEEMLSNPRLNLSCYDEYPEYTDLTFVPNNLILLDDGEEIDICGFKIKVIHTPFHTSGSACYLLEKENILFSGDTLFYSTIGRTDLPTSTARTISSSLRKLIVLADDVKVYPGHGVSTSIEREKKYNSYLRNI